MFRRIHLIVFLCSFGYALYAQKPVMTIENTRHWASVGSGAIANDGRYVLYTIYNETPGEQKLVVQSTETGWKKEFKNASDGAFSGNNLVTMKIGDSVAVLSLGSEHLMYMNDVADYKPVSKHGDWIVYQLKTSPGDLFIYNVTDGTKRQFTHLSNYVLSENSSVLLLHVNDSTGMPVLKLTGLNDTLINTIWSGNNATSPIGFVFDNNAQQLAFTVKNKTAPAAGNEIWYYNKGMTKASLLLKASNSAIDSNLVINNCFRFTDDGKKLFIALQPKRRSMPGTGTVSLDVWSYTDPQLQSVQLEEANDPVFYTAVFNIPQNRFFRITQDDEEIVGRSDVFALVNRHLGNKGLFESHWNDAAKYVYYLISMNDGHRKLLRNDTVNPPNDGMSMSPTGKWIVYYDFRQNDFFSYEVATGVKHNITQRVRKTWIDEKNDEPEISLDWTPQLRTWLANDEYVLIYDSYDVWLVDPLGVRSPECITNGYGRKHGISFRLADEESALQQLSLKEHSIIWLKARNYKNKDFGFYKKILGKKGDPEICEMGPFVYGDWDGYDSYNYPAIKAKDANIYLQKRMSATESPNYFVTKDFRNLKFLTNIQPQKNYNWFTTELYTWKSFDGTILQGVLYKPENFDSTKKYPLIFDYYDKRSDELNLYRVPKASDDRINIPLFVSSGYLVFTPDIHYLRGNPGKSADNAVVSAAQYLSKKRWVDAKRMGIQGHSFGGYETNYIVSHTNLFAAACSASGFCDLINWYLSDARGTYPMYWAERIQGRIGTTPWDKQDLYLSNAPILRANNISTPLLMMNNKNDKVVLFSQGVELFTALRRLGKRVWMLQYDGQRHSVGRGKTAEDYHTRMMQFFDHYLKDSASPKWMLNGIAAKDKGIMDGLELVREKDKNGKWLTPHGGVLLTPEEKKRVNALQKRKQVTITTE